MTNIKYNHTPAEQQTEFEFLLRCLARDVLRNYPNKLKRQQFYANYQKHHGQSALDALQSAIHAEYERFLGWCALFSRVTGHYALTNYLDESIPKIALNRPEHDLSANPNREGSHPPVTSDARELFHAVTVAPWWSDLPHLAPKGQGVNHA